MSEQEPWLAPEEEPAEAEPEREQDPWLPPEPEPPEPDESDSDS
jgi:hypothetical protein